MIPHVNRNQEPVLSAKVVLFVPFLVIPGRSRMMTGRADEYGIWWILLMRQRINYPQ